MTPSRAAGLRRDACVALATFAVALALAAAARYQLVEPAALAHACSDDPGTLTCRFRALLVALFRHQAPGWLAAAAGLASWLLTRRIAPPAPVPPRWRLARVAGLLAVALGATGLVLYSFDPAAAGLVLAAIALTRIAVARHGATASR